MGKDSYAARRLEVLRRAEPIIDDQPLESPAEEIIQSPIYPSDWSKGALLNVRNYGSEYIITLYPEEYDLRYPDRSLHFTNPAECQDFVSKWYSPQHHDPRAR